MKKVSIVVPFHRGLSYLDDCFSSILEQELLQSEYEVICLGDSPEEGIVSKVEEYEKKGLPIRYVQWFENKGAGYSRNKGIELAEAKYIYFLDADDYLLPNTISRLILCAERENVSLVRGTITHTWHKRESNKINEKEILNRIEADRRGSDSDLARVFSDEITALHMLVERDFVLEHKIKFDESVVYYSDILFVMHLFEVIRGYYFVKDAYLAKRYHNDPIHTPSLTQTALNNEWKMLSDLLNVYKSAFCYIKDQPKRKNLMRYILCSNVLSILNKNTKIPESLQKECAIHIREAIKYVSARFNLLQKWTLIFLGNESFYLTRIFAMLLKIQEKKDGIFGNKVQWFRLIDKLFFRPLPRKKNLIVFESFFGKNYNDSPKYIYEEVVRQYGDRFEYVWIINDPSIIIPYKPKRAAFCSLRHIYYSTRAKYHVYNVRQPGWFTKEKDMVFVETWHGTPLKKLAFDLEDIHSADQNHKIMFYKDSRAWDYLISDNIFSSEIFKRAFDLTRDKIIEVGYPRNDILYSKNNVEDINIIKQKLKLPEHKKVALYAPTWRDNIFYEPGKYKFELALNLDSLQEECGDEWVILLRTHYHIADRIDTTKYNGFVYNVSTYDDISELYLVSDVCITDYSSVFFDYANLQRPILYYVYDYELYKNELRGMYLDMERDLPGPLLKTSNEVIGALKNLQKIEEEYEERYNQFYQRYCSIDDGSAAKRVVELVFSGRKSI